MLKRTRNIGFAFFSNYFGLLINKTTKTVFVLLSSTRRMMFVKANKRGFENHGNSNDTQQGKSPQGDFDSPFCFHDYTMNKIGGLF